MAAITVPSNATATGGRSQGVKLRNNALFVLRVSIQIGKRQHPKKSKGLFMAETARQDEERDRGTIMNCDLVLEGVRGVGELAPDQCVTYLVFAGSQCLAGSRGRLVSQ
jgi:hypothetical protein